MIQMKGSYHDDCLEKRKKKKPILHTELGHGGQLLRKYEFCKMPSERNERGKFFSMFDIFLHFFFFFAYLHWGLFC